MGDNCLCSLLPIPLVLKSANPPPPPSRNMRTLRCLFPGLWIVRVQGGRRQCTLNARYRADLDCRN